jgi:hypothetical protein
MVTKKSKAKHREAVVPVEDPENVAARQRKYKSRRRERGEVRVSVWVPRDKAAQLRAIATMWQRKAELKDGAKVQVEISELLPPVFTSSPEALESTQTAGGIGKRQTT